MHLIVDNIQWIMLAAGLLTLTLLQGVLAPKAAFAAFFNGPLESPGAELIIRNWAFLIVLTALFLLYAAFIDPALRAPALILSGAGKLCFVTLVFAAGPRIAKRQAFAAAIIDALFVALFALYLIAARA